jgi:hypothetical protein
MAHQKEDSVSAEKWKEEYDAAVAKAAEEQRRLNLEAERQAKLDAEEKARRKKE